MLHRGRYWWHQQRLHWWHQQPIAMRRLSNIIHTSRRVSVTVTTELLCSRLPLVSSSSIPSFRKSAKIYIRERTFCDNTDVMCNFQAISIIHVWKRKRSNVNKFKGIIQIILPMLSTTRTPDKMNKK